jgi:hypothetical protein
MLICAGKRVGATLLSYLIERGEPVSQVIASTENDQAIMEICKKAGIKCDVFYKGIGKSLAELGHIHDWLLNFWSPHLIPAEMLQVADKRLNLHPSLVPHARGSDSTLWILRKRLPAGVSLIEMTEALDQGGVYAQKAVNVPFPMRGAELHSLLQDEMIDLFKRSWPDIKAGKCIAQPQDQGGSYHRRKETNEDRIRDANMVASLDETLRWMLAHDFSPGTTAQTVIDGIPYCLRLEITKFEP